MNFIIVIILMIVALPFVVIGTIGAGISKVIFVLIRKLIRKNIKKEK
jgi:hypothetical protein